MDTTSTIPKLPQWIHKSSDGKSFICHHCWNSSSEDTAWIQYHSKPDHLPEWKRDAELAKQKPK